jgi:hypothetical protein
MSLWNTHNHTGNKIHCNRVVLSVNGTRYLLPTTDTARDALATRMHRILCTICLELDARPDTVPNFSIPGLFQIVRLHEVSSNTFSFPREPRDASFAIHLFLHLRVEHNTSMCEFRHCEHDGSERKTFSHFRGGGGVEMVKVAQYSCV